MEDGLYRPFADIIAGHARRQPDKLAVVSIAEDRGLTFRELARTADRISAALHVRGIAEQTRPHRDPCRRAGP